MLLPAPLGPITAKNSPGSTASETSLISALVPARTSIASALQRAHRPSRAARPASSQRKKGPPTNAVSTPIGSSAGETMVRASASASTRKAPPNSGGGRQQRAMGGAQQQAHDVRGDQADKAHDARDRHAGADGERDLRHQPALQSLDIDADVARLALA